MQKLLYIFTLLLLCTACSKETDDIEMVSSGTLVRIKIPQSTSSTRVVDEDNLESEQIINNISIFLTEPNSDTFFYSAVRNVTYTLVDDYRLVLLPLNLSELGYKDIYVVTNLDNSGLSKVKNLTELKQMSTPVASKNSNLNPQNGLCMFGKTLNFNFNNETNSPAIVDAVRTCAKYRITLTFPDNPTLSTSNAFIIQGAATNTYLGDDLQGFTPTGYFDFSTPITLNANGEGGYTNVAYTYEAPNAPTMGIYLNYKGNAAATPQYRAALPIPERNYLYDIDVQVYESGTRTSLGAISTTYTSTITTYNSHGEKVDEVTKTVNMQ